MLKETHMKTCFRTTLAACFLSTLLAAPPTTVGLRTPTRPEPLTRIDGQKTSQPRPALIQAKTPLHFEANHGQFPDPVRFRAAGVGYQAWLTDRAAWFGYPGKNQTGAGAGWVKMEWEGADPEVFVAGLERLPGISNYFFGDDPSRWLTKIPHYARVEYKRVYPGVDLVFYGNQQKLEYDFIVSPGADPSRIQLAYEGASSVRIDNQGDLVLTTAAGELRQYRPRVHQVIDGKQVAVEASYRLRGAKARIELARYDATRPLVIDPVLGFATFLGGADQERGLNIAVDNNGNSYITGFTTCSGILPRFPSTPGVVQPNGTCVGLSIGQKDAFVSKFSTDGSTLLFSSYLGGFADDVGNAIALDSSGNAYIVGETLSVNPAPSGQVNFPITGGVVQPNPGGGGSLDAFACKLNSTGSVLSYCTYLGGNQIDRALGVTVDLSGNAFVGGQTLGGYPTTPGAFDTSYNGLEDVFVTKLNPAATARVFSTYLGSDATDNMSGLVTDLGGSVYVTGSTGGGASVYFPTTAGAWDTTRSGTGDGYVTKLAPNGSSLVYSTLVGSNQTHVASISIDGTGHAYIGGFTSDNAVTTPGAYDTNCQVDIFVAKLDPTASSRIWGTCIGSNTLDIARGILLEPSGSIFVLGSTIGTDYPTTPDAYQTAPGPNVLSQLNLTGTAVQYSTYFGSFTDPQGIAMFSMALGPGGSPYLVGYTGPSLPATPGAYDTTYNGLDDTLLVKFTGFCNYGFSTPTTIPVEAPAGSGQVTVTTAAGCPWNVTSDSAAPWLTVTSPTQNAGTGVVNFSFTQNTFPVWRLGRIQIAGPTFLVPQLTSATGPVAGLASPASGGGPTQLFTFGFQHSGGFQNLNILNILVNNDIDAVGACYMAYSQPLDLLYLVPDSGFGLLPPITLGTNQSVSNNHCTILGQGSSVVKQGKALILHLNMQIHAGLAGTNVMYLAARDLSGGNTGWQALGVWNGPGAPPRNPDVTLLSPTRVIGTSQIFTVEFTDQTSISNLGVQNVLINDFVDALRACYVALVWQSNVLFLVNDAGTGVLPGLPLNGTGSVSNSQCTVNGSGTSMTAIGNKITLTLNLSFPPGFKGNKVVYPAARNVGDTATSGWLAMGTLTIP